MKFFVLAFLIPMSLSAWAGGYDLGNGGGAVSCGARQPDNEIFANGFAILDLWEGRVLHGQTNRKLRSLRVLPFEAAFPRALAMFLGRDLQTLALYSHWFRELSIERVRGEVSERDSSSLLTLPNGCRFVPVAVQFLPLVPGQSRTRLVVADVIWSRLASDQKVALLFHEFVLRDAMTRMTTWNRSGLRAAVAELLSDAHAAHPNTTWRERLRAP